MQKAITESRDGCHAITVRQKGYGMVPPEEEGNPDGRPGADSS